MAQKHLKKKFKSSNAILND